MSRVLILASAVRGNAAASSPSDRFAGWFGDLERAVQFANIAGDPHYGRLVLIDPDEDALDFAGRAVGEFCEVEQVSSANDLAEIQHHVAAFAPRALVAVAPGCAERLALLTPEPAVWCDLAGSPFADPQSDSQILAQVLAFGDRFSASTTMARGVILGALGASGLLGAETLSYQPVVSIPFDYPTLRSSVSGARAKLSLATVDSDPATFRLLCVSLCEAADAILAAAVARAREELGESSDVLSIFVDEPAMLAQPDTSSQGTSVLVNLDRHSQIPALYDQCELAVVVGSEGLADAAAGARLRDEMVALGLPVLSAPVHDLPGAVALGSRCDVDELAEKLVWAVRHRGRLRDLTRKEAAVLAVQGERSSGRTRFEQWLDSPVPAERELPQALAAEVAEDEVSFEIPDPARPSGLTGVKRWLESL